MKWHVNGCIMWLNYFNLKANDVGSHPVFVFFSSCWLDVALTSAVYWLPTERTLYTWPSTVGGLVLALFSCTCTAHLVLLEPTYGRLPTRGTITVFFKRKGGKTQVTAYKKYKSLNDRSHVCKVSLLII